MERSAFLGWLTPLLVLSFAYSFGMIAIAQDYYPADIGNTWVLESEDGAERTTYTLEGPERLEGQTYTLLKVSTEELSTGEIDTDTYFVTVGAEAIELHKTIFELKEPAAVITADFPRSAVFFPLQLELGDRWQISAKAAVELAIGLAIAGTTVTDLEVVGFEDVVTPAGTFQNCAKVELTLNFAAGGFLNIDSGTIQWFAPDIGPIQYQNNDGVIFSLVSTNLPIVPAEPDVPTAEVETETPEEPTVLPEPIPDPVPEEVLPEPVPYDLTGDGVVNVLDLTVVASRFGETDSDADLTGDGVVDILDLVLIARNLDN